MTLLRAVISIFVLLAVLAAAGLGGGWVWLQDQINRPGPLIEETVFVVEPGEGLGAIAARAQRDGVIGNARVLRLAARLENVQRDIKTGEFVVAPRISMADFLDLLVEGRVRTYRITIPEGRTTAQALRIIEADPTLVGPLPDPPPAEGALLPDTYVFSRGDTRIELVERMKAAQTALIAELWPGRQADLPFETPEEAVILASVVEKETGLASERPQIAGLFVGRLKRGMRLESDPTIIYGVSRGEPLYNRRGQRRTLYRSEIDRETPWNTYQIDGLPATPICNPGRDAIAAVLNPPETKYVFFVADGEGGHLFAETLAEHNRNVARYRRIERERIAEERAGE